MIESIIFIFIHRLGFSLPLLIDNTRRNCASNGLLVHVFRLSNVIQAFTINEMPAPQSPDTTVPLFFRGKIVTEDERFKTTCAYEGGSVG